MKLKIVTLDFGRTSEFLDKKYIIMIKRYWFSSWKIRDWENERFGLPRFYSSFEEAKKHL